MDSCGPVKGLCLYGEAIRAKAHHNTTMRLRAGTAFSLFALLARASAALRIDPLAEVPDGRVLVCLSAGVVWWRSSAADARRHQTRPEFVDRLVGTLQLFYQLGPHGKHAPPPAEAPSALEEMVMLPGGGAMLPRPRRWRTYGLPSAPSCSPSSPTPAAPGIAPGIAPGSPRDDDPRKAVATMPLSLIHI